MYIFHTLKRSTVSLLAAILFLTACGGQPESPAASATPVITSAVISAATPVQQPANQPSAVAETAFTVWATNNGEPYRDVRVIEESNDGLFARMRVLAYFKHSAETDWEEREANIECRQVGGAWQCGREFNFTISRGMLLANAQDAGKKLGLESVQMDAETGIISASNPRDQAVYVYVPAGEFLMGSTQEQADAAREACEDVLGKDCATFIFEIEQPQHTVNLDGYWIMQTEVTNAMYAKCVAAGNCSPPVSMTSGEDNSLWLDEALADHPVTTVTWDQAQDYAKWAGGRLPTEAEWEKAARGTNAWLYPWGDAAPDCDKMNFFDYTRGDRLAGACVPGTRGDGSTNKVGSYPSGASPYGALDMAGNASEWVNDWFSADYYKESPKNNPQGPETGDLHMDRGGSFSFPWFFARSAYREVMQLDRREYLGFRLVAGN